MKALLDRISQLGKIYHAGKIVLFGSRARGDNRTGSDIDLAIYGMSSHEQPYFRAAVEELPTLLEFDFVFVTERTNPALLENIRQDGVILMDKALEKREHLHDALLRLQEALNEYHANPSDVVRDGVIQRFEFCTELAWKAAREYLLDQGYTEINSPKSTMKKAYADGLIADGDAWISLLNDRNSTSHIYDDATAEAVFERICTMHLTQLKALDEKLQVS